MTRLFTRASRISNPSPNNGVLALKPESWEKPRRCEMSSEEEKGLAFALFEGQGWGRLTLGIKVSLIKWRPGKGRERLNKVLLH